MKSNYYKKISRRSQSAMHRWDAHKFWNRESKKGYHRKLKEETSAEIRDYYNNLL